jgi:hypothetical protein
VWPTAIHKGVAEFRDPFGVTVGTAMLSLRRAEPLKPFRQVFNLRSARRPLRRHNRSPLHLLDTVLQHRAISLGEHVLAHVNAQVRPPGRVGWVSVFYEIPPLCREAVYRSRQGDVLRWTPGGHQVLAYARNLPTFAPALSLPIAKRGVPPRLRVRKSHACSVERRRIE